jgi:hypothetical protein
MIGTAKLTSWGTALAETGAASYTSAADRVNGVELPRPDSLKVGDKVQVSGVRAKKPESNRIGQAQITMPDGRIFARGAGNNNYSNPSSNR